MKVLVTGVRGQLGFDVVNELTARGIEALGGKRRSLPKSQCGGHQEYSQGV